MPTPYQKSQFQEALIEQAKYMYKTGDTGLNSGFDQEHNTFTDLDKLEQITVGRDALRILVDAGMFNLTVNTNIFISLLNKQTWKNPI